MGGGGGGGVLCVELEMNINRLRKSDGFFGK